VTTRKAAPPKRRRVVQAQDTGYKRLFSHPEMVADLLRGYVPELTGELDLQSLERCNGSYASPDLRERRSDVVWRLPLKDRWINDGAMEQQRTAAKDRRAPG
jgi:hypothetical protein